MQREAYQTQSLAVGRERRKMSHPNPGCAHWHVQWMNKGWGECWAEHPGERVEPQSTNVMRAEL